ncbi:hypothetical protein JY75_08830 [Neisseria meningitidis]|nr:hypothetical protein JY18_01825 [Neisseria meningitidis]RPB99936.1 hypothetical protein JY21_04485 [Neisseria meningitidis]RPC91527.1 hypothetical protein JY71_07680 [Neisseria meningitidis]RPC91712.1 hypothetical protein JY70_01810 [Neisseria meningitidis]RPC94518.1 hypothetical protein JY73_09375 [Neisseria meningitidis]
MPISLFNLTFIFRMRALLFQAESGLIPCGLKNKIIYRLIKSGLCRLHAITFCREIGYSNERNARP